MIPLPRKFQKFACRELLFYIWLNQYGGFHPHNLPTLAAHPLLMVTEGLGGFPELLGSHAEEIPIAHPHHAHSVAEELQDSGPLFFFDSSALVGSAGSAVSSFICAAHRRNVSPVTRFAIC